MQHHRFFLVANALKYSFFFLQITLRLEKFKHADLIAELEVNSHISGQMTTGQEIHLLNFFGKHVIETIFDTNT